MSTDSSAHPQLPIDMELVLKVIPMPADCNANGQPDDCECLGDMNGDRQITIADHAVFLSSFGICAGQPGFNAAADFDGSGCVDIADMGCFLGRFGSTCP